MRKFLTNLLGSAKAEQLRAEARDQEQLSKVDRANEALLNAAGSTLLVAQDITSILKSRIDDFTSQIEATSQVLNDALILVSSDGRLENANSAAERIFGYEKNFMIGLNLSHLFSHCKGAEINIKMLKNLFTADTNILELIRTNKLEIRGMRIDGVQFYPNIRIKEFERSDGSTKYMLLVQDITDMVLSEQRFLNMFEQQAATLKALPDLLIIVNRRMRVQQVISGFEHDSLITDDHAGKNLKDILSQENFELFRHHCNSITEESSMVAWGFSIQHDNGVLTYYEARATSCGDEILIVIRDVTDIVITREELLESEEHFRVFGQASSEAMIIHNDYQILDWNPRFSEMTGYSSLEISNMNPNDFIHPMERSTIQTHSTNSAYTTLFVSKSGRAFEVAVNDRYVEWKNEAARIKVIRDITHLKDVDQILHLSRERYKGITDNTFDIVVSFGQDLKMTFMNQTFNDYFSDQLRLDMTLEDFIDPRDMNRLRTHIEGLTDINQVGRTLVRVKHDGQTRWLDWITRIVLTQNGQFLEYQGIGRDVTDYIKMSKKNS